MHMQNLIADTGVNANAPKGRSASPSNAAFNTWGSTINLFLDSGDRGEEGCSSAMRNTSSTAPAFGALPSIESPSTVIIVCVTGRDRNGRRRKREAASEARD